VTQVDARPPAIDDDHWSGWTPPSERSVRRRRLIVLLVVVLVLAVSFSWLLSYDPLQQSYNGPYSAGLTAASGAKVHTVAVGRHGTVASQSTLGHQYLGSGLLFSAPIGPFWIEPSGQYTVNYEATITNRSPVSITIDNIYAPLAHPRGAHVRTYFYNANIYSGKGRRFHSIGLGAHDKLSVVVTFRQQCIPSATTTSSGTVAAMPVTYSMFGLSHTTTVPILPFGIQSRRFC
jgi:hypothetical protein